MRKNVLPQAAVIPSRVRVASSGGLGRSRHLDEPEGDRGSLGEVRARAGVDAVDEAEAEVVVDVLDRRPRTRPPRGSAWADSQPEATRPPGTSTSSGPSETTKPTWSPRNSVPSSGLCEMTSPSATVSEYSSVELTSKPLRSRAVRASTKFLPVQSVTVSGLRPLLTYEVDDGAGPQGLAGRRVAAQHRALGHRLGPAPDGLAEGEVGVEQRVLRLVHRRALGARDVVPLLAQRDHERDRAAVEDPVAGRRVGAEHATLGHGLGVRRVADLDVEAGGLELLLGGGSGSCRGRPGSRCSAPSRTTRRPRPRPATSNRASSRSSGPRRGPARPADRGDPGDLAGRRHGAAVERRGAVHHGGRLGGRRHLGRHPGELVDVERVRLRCPRARAAATRPQGAGRAVSSSSSRTPSRERLGDPVDLVQQHAGVGGPLVAVAGGGPGDQRVDVRRDARARPSTAAGTSSCTCL